MSPINTKRTKSSTQSSTNNNHNHHHLRSTSRPPLSTIPPNRVLRWTRFLFYCWAAPNFLYSLYVQLIVLKGPDRIPLPASVNFGRDSLFLTFHGNFHCTWYACLCLLDAFLSLAKKTKRRPSSSTAKSIEANVYRFTSLLFPLASFVGLAYYLILHFHPMNRLRAQLVPDHDAKMALLHFNPLLFVLIDSILKDSELLSKYGLKQTKAVKYITAYGTMYFSWTVFCTRFNGGYWPYPFQQSFTPIQHLLFLLLSISSSIYLTRAGFRLHGRIDRRRRRRISTMLERNITSSFRDTNERVATKIQSKMNCVTN